MKKVGLLVGRERSFPDALIAKISERKAGVIAEYVKLDLTRVDALPRYDVIIDRISHDVTCYQPILKAAALSGCHVINNPFWRIADDKAFGAALAERLGIPVPKTYILPSKEYSEDISSESLHNLKYPLSWSEMIQDLGWPVYLKPHWGGGFRDVFCVRSFDELWHIYDRTGRKTMIAQETIEWAQYVRCIVIGHTHINVLPWDPRQSHYDRYAKAASSMPLISNELQERIKIYAQKLCQALGYEMNTCEFAIREGEPYAIDFMNSAPDFDVSSLGEETFEWVVNAMSEFIIKLAHEPHKVKYRWDALLTKLDNI